jgi:hypothetical protein
MRQIPNLRYIASFLRAGSRHDGYFEGKGYQVTWALGHLATLKEPEDYDPALLSRAADRPARQRPAPGGTQVLIAMQEQCGRPARGSARHVDGRHGGRVLDACGRPARAAAPGTAGRASPPGPRRWWRPNQAPPARGARDTPAGAGCLNKVCRG